jgi:5-carboxymethyl-2-hydroxymuconic-semialdehyde dehydrogenase
MSQLETNIAKADGYLKRFKSGVLNHINGESRPAASGRTFQTATPVDQTVLASVASSDGADVDAAAKAAKAAFPGWAAIDGEKRKAVLHAIADGIEARAEEIAFVECIDTGQSLRFMSKAALRGAENFRFFADMAPEARDGKTLRAPGQVNLTGRTPL